MPPVCLRYCETVKNVTVAIPDDVYRRARIKAAHEGTSVSALVAAHLRDLTDDDDFATKAALQDQVMREIAEFSGADRLSRDDVHDRALR